MAFQGRTYMLSRNLSHRTNFVKDTDPHSLLPCRSIPACRRVSANRSDVLSSRLRLSLNNIYIYQVIFRSGRTQYVRVAFLMFDCFCDTICVSNILSFFGGAMKKLISVFLLGLMLGSNGLATDNVAEIDAATAKIMPQVIEWRRYIHQNPELSNREVNTAKLIENQLRKLGLEVRTGIAKTGVVGILKGGKPGPVIGLRADMDALPVTERVDVPYKSVAKGEYNGQMVGVMHACGHDTHVAMLLGAANVLAGMKDKIKGTVVFIFQPAEEGPPAGEEGGAPLMVKEGVMDNPKIDAIFGIHINSQTPIGTIRYKSGSIMAASDWFEIKVKGRQTHGAYPWSGIDPIAVATQIYTGLQMIVARQSNLPKAPVVITVGRINGGVRENIIPKNSRWPEPSGRWTKKCKPTFTPGSGKPRRALPKAWEQR